MPTELTLEAAIIELNRIKTDTYPTTDFDRRNAALERAKQAVRKQIPRKPKEQYYENQSGENGYKLFCQCCDARVFEVSDNYCPECGQALDWR